MTPRAATPLEPCPFCGGEPLEELIQSNSGWAVVCGEDHCDGSGPSGGSEEVARRWWNRRAPSALVAELVEAACQFGPILKTFGWWDWTPAELSDLADYDDELPAILKNASRRLYDAIEEYKLQSALARAWKERG